MITINATEQCPSCNENVEWLNNVIYCRNAQCPSRIDKKLEHFAKTLKIKGFGPSTISKLGFTSINDIYSTDIVGAISSVTIAKKIEKEIEQSKSAPLNILLPAFSIPLIGNTASAKLAKVCLGIEDINNKTCNEAGLGPKATESLLGWLETEFPEYKDLPFSFMFESAKTAIKTRGIVCISGKLKSFPTKAEATKALEAAGYVVKSTVTKDVTVLVNEGGVESSKTIKARESGITVVENLLNFLEK